MVTKSSVTNREVWLPSGMTQSVTSVKRDISARPGLGRQWPGQLGARGEMPFLPARGRHKSQREERPHRQALRLWTCRDSTGSRAGLNRPAEGERVAQTEANPPDP